MDREKMAQDLALEFAVSQQEVNVEEPEKQLQKMLEDYCFAYGSLSSTSDEYIKALIQRGE